MKIECNRNDTEACLFLKGTVAKIFDVTED